MDQSRALNALAPFLALAKSATSPRAAADLITQATSAPNTYVFAELLQHPNLQQLRGHEQYAGFYELLTCFAWGTWESYRIAAASQGLPELSSSQTTKLKLLSLLTIAAQKQHSASSTTTTTTTTNTTTAESNLSYSSLCQHLSLPSSIDLEHLVTEAIYSDLLTGSLNPAAQTVVITSVAPLRDLAPGSVAEMISELSAWSGRCDSVLAELEAEIEKVKNDAKRRHARDQKAEKQIKAVAEAVEKSAGGMGTRRTRRGDAEEDDGRWDDPGMDPMDLDNDTGTIGALGGGGGKKRGGGLGGLMGRFGGGARSSRA